MHQPLPCHLSKKRTDPWQNAHRHPPAAPRCWARWPRYGPHSVAPPPALRRTAAHSLGNTYGREEWREFGTMHCTSVGRHSYVRQAYTDNQLRSTSTAKAQGAIGQRSPHNAQAWLRALLLLGVRLQLRAARPESGSGNSMKGVCTPLHAWPLLRCTGGELQGQVRMLHQSTSSYWPASSPERGPPPAPVPS